MIYQRFGQGVSNLSTVAELRTFDGIDFPNLSIFIREPLHQVREVCLRQPLP
jgi:hypothetical protein